MEWTKTLSKSTKRELKKKENAQKRVCSAVNVAQPPKKINSSSMISITFGAFTTQVDPSELRSSSLENLPCFCSKTPLLLHSSAHRVHRSSDVQRKSDDRATVRPDQLPLQGEKSGYVQPPWPKFKFEFFSLLPMPQVGPCSKGLHIQNHMQPFLHARAYTKVLPKELKPNLEMVT